MSSELLPELLTPAEVARLLRVETKTVARWANQGKLTSIRLPGGHRRYHADDGNRLLEPVAVAR